MSTLSEFKQFLLRGNVVDLAVGVVVGAAFGTVVQALVKDILMPFIGAIAKVPDFSDLSFSINGSVFLYGDFLNALIAFLLVSAAVFFCVVKPMNALVKRTKGGGGATAGSGAATPATPTAKKCSECLSDIPLAAKRCAYCAQIA